MLVLINSDTVVVEELVVGTNQLVVGNNLGSSDHELFQSMLNCRRDKNRS